MNLSAVPQVVVGLALCAAGAAEGAPTASADGVISYPATFFAANQPVTALDIVNLIPGFVFDKGAGVRGYRGGAPNVLIDGARLASKDDNVEAVLRRIPADQIERVDLIRGGAPGIDMQGKSLVANLVRRSKPGAAATLTASIVRDAQANVEGMGRAEWQWRNDGWFFEGAAQIGGAFDDAGGVGPKVRVDGSGRLILTGTESQFGVQQDNLVTVAAEHEVGGGNLRLSGSFTDLPYGAISVDTLVQPPGGDLDNYHQSQKTAETSARYDRDFGDRFNLEVVALSQLGWDGVDDHFSEAPEVAAITGDDTSDIFHLRDRRGEHILSARVRYEISNTLELNTGAEVDYNWLSSHTTYIENGSPVMLPAADEYVAEWRTEAFALFNWRPDQLVNLDAGLRVEGSRLTSSGTESSDQSFVYPKPRVLLTLSPTPVDQIRLRVEREVGQLDFNNFVASPLNIETGQVRAGNPQLTPQSDWVFEGATERRFWDSGDLTLTFRHYVLYDVIDRVPVFAPSGTFDAPGNIGGGRKDEASIALDLPLDRVGLTGARISGLSTWRWSRVIDPTTGVPRSISALPPNTWELHLSESLPRQRTIFGIDAVGEYRSENYRFDEIDIDRLQPYVVAFAEYKPEADLAIRLEVRNLTNRDYFHTRIVYFGDRSNYPIDFIETRNIAPGRYLYLRVIKSLS
ncbi:MAG TPA: TonB-dependent receptor plug domain-containing protein [Caulobacteraceae bacterium]|nr:TonB-dependent receptor plug domain-containing protein [Caulobacteraceae bacterium]